MFAMPKSEDEIVGRITEMGFSKADAVAALRVSVLWMCLMLHVSAQSCICCTAEDMLVPLNFDMSGGVVIGTCAVLLLPEVI